MARPNQVNTTFDDKTRQTIEAFVERYGKRDKSQVVYEIVTQYIHLYEQAEEAKRAALIEQGALGKAQASASTERRTRKSA